MCISFFQFKLGLLVSLFLFFGASLVSAQDVPPLGSPIQRAGEPDTASKAKVKQAEPPQKQPGANVNEQSDEQAEEFSQPRHRERQIEPAEEREVPRRRRRRTPLYPGDDEPVQREYIKDQKTKKKTKRSKTSGMAPTPLHKGVEKSAITEKMKVEVVDQPITNLFRLISRTYKINIVPDAELSDIKVTINLENISVREGLRVICNAHGLEMNEVGDVIYIQKASDKAITEMNLYAKRIDINVENKPVKEFIKEFAEKTKISIVPDQDLEGKVTGHLKNVLPINGFKALMAANNYQVRQKGGIYLVEKLDKEEGSLSRRRRMRSPTGPVDIDVIDGKVNASLKAADLGSAIRSIADQSNMNMITYGELTGSLDAELTDVPVVEALSMLLQGTQYTFIIKEGMLLIGEKNPKTASGAVLSTVELINLKYIRADQAVKLIPKSIPQDGIMVMNEQNAVLITGTAADIKRVREFFEQIDLPVPQVMLEVVIVEYERTSSSDLGVDLGEGAADQPRLGANVLGPGVKASFERGSFWGSIRVLPQDWSLHLRASLEKNRGKVLAMPKITTLNGNKAHLRVRRTQYHPVTSFNPQGTPATDFRAIDDGITIDLTPWVTRHGDVNLEIKPSIKTSSPSSDATRPDPVTDRAINTNVRLMDGETLILGGLIDSKETYRRKFVPILGHIPILGYLFSWRSKVLSTTELVLYVTPHILEEEFLGVDLGEELDQLDKRGGFIKEKDFVKELEKSKKKSKNGKEESEKP